MTGPGKNPSEQGVDRRPPLQRAIPLRGLNSPDEPDPHPQPEESGSWGAPKLPFWPAQPVTPATPPPRGAEPASSASMPPAGAATPGVAPSAREATPGAMPSVDESGPAVRQPAAATFSDDRLPAVADSPDAPRGGVGEPRRDGAETTAGLMVTPVPLAEAGPAVDARPAPRPRLWLVPLILIGAIVITAAAFAGRGLGPDGTDTPVAIPPATSGAPATGQVTVVTPSAGPTSAGPSATASAAPSSAAPSRTASATPVPPRTTPAAAASTTRAPAASGPITGYSACTTGSAAVLAVTFTEPFDWHHAYIDVDGNASTGYAVPDISGRLGADYMVENDGLFRANDTEWDWSEIEDSGLRAARTGNTFRWQVPRSALKLTGTLRVVFNGSGNTPDTSTPIVTAASC